MSALLISIGISERSPSAGALLHRAGQELLHVGHEEPLVSPLGDLLLVVPRLDREEKALAVGLEQGGLRAHREPHRCRGQMLHLDHGADGAGAGREMRPHHCAGGVLEHAGHERRGEDVDSAIAMRVGGLTLVDPVGELCGSADLDLHEVRFYRGNRSECKPITTSSTSMMARNTRSLMRSRSLRPTQEPANIVAPSTAPTATVSQVKRA